MACDAIRTCFARCVPTGDCLKNAAAVALVVVALAAIGAVGASFLYTGKIFAVTAAKTALTAKLGTLWANVVTLLATSALATGLFSLAWRIKPETAPSSPKAPGAGPGAPVTT